jgi:CRP/FNR family cyclic AMP-dependent transcriptional regulator
MKSNLAHFLNTVAAFEDFEREEIDTLERALVLDEFPDGHVFCAEGKASDRMYIVVEGQVVVTRERISVRGEDELAVLGSGDMFGLVSLVDSGPHSATCTARGPVTAAYLPRSAFELLFKTRAHVGYHFQELIARQLVNDMRTYTALLLKRLGEQQDG